MQAQCILRVKVDNGYAEAKLRQPRRHVGCNRGFTDSAFRRAKEYQRQEGRLRNE